jgi:hypothetical protein
MQAPENAQEDLLRHILGIVPIVQDSCAQAEHLALKPLDEAFHGRRVALQTSADQIGVVGHGGSRK